MKTQLFVDKTPRYTETQKPNDKVELLGYDYGFRIQCGEMVYTTAWYFGSESDIKDGLKEQQRLLSGCEVEVVR